MACGHQSGSWRRVLFACCAFVILAGACEADDAAAPRREPAPADAGGGEDAEVLTTADGRPLFCERDRSDKVRDLFCADGPVSVTDLADLQQRLGLVPGGLVSRNADMYGASSFVTLLAHSTSSSARKISPLNPRMIVIGEGAIMAFERGVQYVELVAYGREPGQLHFYLVEFEQACNREQAGCGAGDLFTPRVEQDWQHVTVRDDEDLKNTPQDCRQCHQRASDFPVLLMRELDSPWTHFMQAFPEGDEFIGPGVQGHDLLRDYLAAKGDERYGGFNVSDIVRIAPFVLQSTVPLGQPLLFDARGIENERFPFDPDTGYPSEAAPSRIWEDAYDAFKRGDQLALPYVEPRVTDVTKHARLSEAYEQYRDGELSERELPDLADIFPDDPDVRARIGLQTEPDATAEDTLLQACGSCHNDILDQEVSRARFNIDLWKLDAREIARAIERIELAPNARGVMPPPQARQLDPAARKRLLDFLRDDPLKLPPDLKLQRAGRIGMTGGAAR